MSSSVLCVVADPTAPYPLIHPAQQLHSDPSDPHPFPVAGPTLGGEGGHGGQRTDHPSHALPPNLQGEGGGRGQRTDHPSHTPAPTLGGEEGDSGLGLVHPIDVTAGVEHPELLDAASANPKHLVASRIQDVDVGGIPPDQVRFYPRKCE